MKTTDKDQLLINIQNIFRIKNELSGVYEQEIFRKLNLQTYRNKIKVFERFFHKFRKVFGKPEEIVICIGDWSQKQHMKHQQPTIGKEVRRLFTEVGEFPNFYLVK